MAGTGVTLYATTAAGNKTVIGTIDWREDIYMPSQINDNVAQIMSDIRNLVNNIGFGWIEVGDGEGVYTASYVSATQFTFSGVDVTAYYRAGVRVRVVAPTPVSLSGTIVTAVFTTGTLVTVVWDAGALSNEAITAVQIGIGSGDVSSAAVFTQCRLVYSTTTTMTLQRYGVEFLTIDNAKQVIPAAGVVLTVLAGHVGVNPMYIWASMPSGVMTLTATAAVTPAIDARNGLPVYPGDATLTFVGQAYCNAGPILLEDDVNQAVSSYWNRRPRVYGIYHSTSTASGTMTPIHNPIKILNWTDQAFMLTHTGYAQLSAVGIALQQILANTVGIGQVQLGYFPAANSQLPTALAFVGYGANGLTTYQLGAYVSGSVGNGTWSGTTYAHVAG